jgi:hypothetical protein
LRAGEAVWYSKLSRSPYVRETHNINNGETLISAREHHDILKDFYFNFYFKVFSGTLLQAKKLFEIMQTKSNDAS